MDQLSFFIGMMKNYLDQDGQERFWSRIREDCPDLMQVIDTLEQPQPFIVMHEVTFTWDFTSPAFDPDLVFADE